MGVVMIDRSIRPMFKRGILASSVLLIALMAMTGIALAERPVAGHWDGTNGVRFQVEHPEGSSNTLVKHIHFHADHRFPHSWTFRQDEFESCYSYVMSTSSERHWCINGQFSSPHHASGTVISFLTAPGHHARFHTHRYEWTAVPAAEGVG
jgi:hypothetical protein